MHNDSVSEICGFGVRILFPKIIRLNIIEQQLNSSFSTIKKKKKGGSIITTTSHRFTGWIKNTS